MLKLKRQYGRDREGKLYPLPVIGVLRASDRMHLSPNLVQGGIMEGWLAMGEGRIVIHGLQGDVVYRIDALPGDVIVDGRREVHNYYDCVRVK